MSATEPAAKKSRYLLTDWNPNDESKWGLEARVAHAVDHDLLADPGLLRVVPAQRDRAQADCPWLPPG